jgi:hypothetical protein
MNLQEKIKSDYEAYGCTGEYDRDRAGGWRSVAPHYERISSNGLALLDRSYRNQVMSGVLPVDEEMSSLDSFGMKPVESGWVMLEVVDDEIGLSRLNSALAEHRPMRSEREAYSAHFLTVTRCWQAQGAPLVNLGPVMTEELRALAKSYEYRDDFIPSLMEKLPFKFFYLKCHMEKTGDHLGDHIEGAYICNSKHNGRDSLCVLIDDGFTLDPWHCVSNNDGYSFMVGHNNVAFTELSNLVPYGNRRAKAGWMLTVLDGLLRYLDSVNREVKDPTPAIRAALNSGKKSKIRKALNQMVGKRKIWIEPTLERKAVEQGITGAKLSSGHIRRGHLHTYYTGARLDADGLRIPKEKRRKVVKFVAPTWVGPRMITAEPREYGIRARR